VDTQHLTDEERAKIGLQVDLMIRVISERYEVTPADVIAAVKWVEDHKEFVTRLKNGGWLALIGFLISALMLAVWEGAKHFLAGPKP
jgi:hypothetical protein